MSTSSPPNRKPRAATATAKAAAAAPAARATVAKQQKIQTESLRNRPDIVVVEEPELVD